MNDLNDLRRNGIVGIIDVDGLQPTSLHFAEWWNGEGCDYTFNHGEKDERHVSLHMDDLEALVTAAIAGGFIDIDTCKEKAEELERASEERDERIRQFNKTYKGVEF